MYDKNPWPGIRRPGATSFPIIVLDDLGWNLPHLYMRRLGHIISKDIDSLGFLSSQGPHFPEPSMALVGWGERDRAVNTLTNVPYS